VTKMTVIASFLSNIIWTTRTHLSYCVGAGFDALQILCNWVDFFLAVELDTEKTRNTKLRNTWSNQRKSAKTEMFVYFLWHSNERGGLLH
jgi:hypothetical protein